MVEHTARGGGILPLQVDQVQADRVLGMLSSVRDLLFSVSVVGDFLVGSVTIPTFVIEFY